MKVSSKRIISGTTDRDRSYHATYEINGAIVSSANFTALGLRGAKILADAHKRMIVSKEHKGRIKTIVKPIK